MRTSAFELPTSWCLQINRVRECRKYQRPYSNHDIKFFVLLHQRHPHRTWCQGKGRCEECRGALRTEAQHLHRGWRCQSPRSVSSGRGWGSHPVGETSCWSQSVWYLQRGVHKRGEGAQRTRWEGLLWLAITNLKDSLHRNTPENKLTISFVSCVWLYFHKSGILKWDKVNQEKKGKRQKVIWKQSKCVLSRWHVCAVSFFG